MSDRNDPGLIEAAKRGDVAARNRLIVANLGLIYKAIAMVLTPSQMRERDAYLGVAVEGFCRALRGFDPARGMLSTYATAVVRQVVRRERDTRRGVIVVPQLDHKTSERRVGDAVRAMKCRSLDSPRGGKDGDGVYSLMSGLKARVVDREEGPGGERAERIEWLREALAALEDREREVVLMRAEGKTLKDVAAVFGLSRWRVRQVQDAAEGKMRAVVFAGRGGVKR